jgi:ABC-type antimicrobial peptide transport system permease subunit
MYSIKIAFRNILRNGLYSFINIIGIAVSLAACTFIVLWIRDERSYDRFHRDAENIYLSVAHFKSEGNVRSVDITAGMFARAIVDNYAEAESYCRLRQSTAGYLRYGDVKTGEKPLLYADSSFFDFFNFAILDGNRQGLLRNADEAIVSRSLARELFADGEALGTAITIDGKTYHVAAVMDDFPANTSVPRAELVLSNKADNEIYRSLLNSWGSCEFLSYVRFRPDANTDATKIARETTATQTAFREMRTFSLQPLVNMHLYTIDGDAAGAKTVSLFQWIALIILCIACINYINLVTARAARRTHEIALRKTLGARIHTLLGQLLAEAAILFILALALAILLNALLMPAYKHLSGKETVFNPLDGRLWATYGAMLLFVLLAAGLYPAWRLAVSGNNSQTMRKRNSGIVFRRTLVVVQFVAAISLIVGTVATLSQLNYIRSKNLGYDSEQLFTIEAYGMREHFAAIRTELLRNTAIAGVTAASIDITNAISTNAINSWEGKTGDGTLMHNQCWADSAFFDVMRIPLVAGHGFTSSPETQYIINEAAAVAAGIAEPVGKWIETRGSIRGTIVGVVGDFHFKSLRSKIEPMIFYHAPQGWNIYIRASAGQATQALAAVERLWTQYNPNHSFSYTFLDEKFDRMYRTDRRTGSLFAVFSLVAILISCLGLFGLVTFAAETRTKEIGIRKVLGASVAELVIMLSREFLILVGVAMLVSFPLAYLWLNSMLQNYAYRIDIAWWMFALAAVITILLTLLTVCRQAYRAATANPVKAIMN